MKIIELAAYRIEDLDMDSIDSVQESLRGHLDLVTTHTDDVAVLSYVMKLRDLHGALEQQVPRSRLMETLDAIIQGIAEESETEGEQLALAVQAFSTGKRPLRRAATRAAVLSELDEAVSDAPQKVRDALALVIKYLECVTGTKSEK